MIKQNIEKFYKLKCVKCGKVFNENITASSCLKCGGPLDAEYDYDYIKSKLNYYALKNAPISATKYLNFYPIINPDKLITLNEGGTSLRKSKKIALELGLNNLYFKDETSNPTGGFKDRGTMVEVTKAKEMGAKAIVVASTGNMAASVSAYASQAGIPAYIVVPEGTPLGKLSQTLAYGARMIQVRATYSECAKLTEKIAKKYNFYLAGDYVFRGEGQKSQGYEIVEQLLWHSPDYLIVPVGCGTNLSAIVKGIREFYQLGLTDKMPKVIGVQPVGANVVVEAYKRKSRKMKAINNPYTVCSAVAVSYPLDGLKALNDIYETGGMAVEVTDEETLSAEKELASKESIFAEPSAALPLAALKKLARKKIFKKADKIVCVITGNGLKDPVTMLRILPSPPSIEPDMKEVDKYLKMKLYDIQGTVEKDKIEELWNKKPNRSQLVSAVKKQFKIDLSDDYIKNLEKEVKKFFIKSEKMVRSDLGIMITASHNPAEYNGCKFVDKRTMMPIGLDSGLDQIRNMVEKYDFADAVEPGKAETMDLKKKYIDFIFSCIDIEDIKPLKIIIDMGNGVEGVLIDDFIKKLPVKAEYLYKEPDGNFPNHEANPLKYETLKDLQKCVLETGADMGFAFDADADRVGLVDEKGNIVPGDKIIVLLAPEMLKKYPGGAILYDVKCSRSVFEIISANGGRPIESRVGRTLLIAGMRKEEAAFGGELSGHFYYKDLFGFESGDLTLLYILKVASESGKKMSELAAESSKYFHSGEINFEIETPDEAMLKLEKKYSPNAVRISKMDGIKIEFADWWFCIRKSNTEPLLRLALEADTEEKMKEKLNEVSASIFQK